MKTVKNKKTLEEKCVEVMKKHKANIQKAKAEKRLTIDEIESIIIETSRQIEEALLEDGGEEISDVEDEEWDGMCPFCGRRMGINKISVALPVTTIKGKIINVRDYYFCRRCHEGTGVNDRVLGIREDHRYTKRVIEHIAYAAQNSGSFERASRDIQKYKEIEISSTVIRHISEEIGNKVFRKDMEEAEQYYSNPALAYEEKPDKYKKEGTLNIMMDGVMVSTNITDEEGKMQWKEMKLGEVFTDKDIIKNKSGDLIIVNKEYTAYMGSAEEFKKLLFKAAIEAGYGTIKRAAVIADGAPWITKISEELFPDAVHILDYYHLSENVHKYALLVYPEDEIGRKRWVNSILNALEEGRVQDAIDIAKNKRVENIPVGTVNLPDYMEKNKHKINYKKFKNEGYFIGSGAIESGNKMVIQRRMVQSGMHWGIEVSQYIATLRAKYESGLWKEVEEVIGL